MGAGGGEGGGAAAERRGRKGRVGLEVEPVWTCLPQERTDPAVPQEPGTSGWIQWPWRVARFLPCILSGSAAAAVSTRLCPPGRLLASPLSSSAARGCWAGSCIPLGFLVCNIRIRIPISQRCFLNKRKNI